MALLAGLDRIEWGRFHHAYGPANDVPGLLRAIASDELAPEAIKEAAKKRGTSIFEHVTWTLYGNVFHQGSVWGVSAKVVPFFVEILESDVEVERRRFIVEYLHHLALSYPHDTFPRPFDLQGLLDACADVEKAKLPQSVIDGDAFGRLPEGTDPNAANGVGALWIRDCFLAVEAAIPRVAPFLEDVDDKVVGSVISLTASFPRAKASSAPRLWTLAKEETDSPLAGMALVSLAVLGEPGVATAAQVVADAAAGKLGALYAAIAEVLASRGGEVSAPAQEALLSVPEAWMELDCPFAGSVANVVNRAMVRLPSSARQRVVETIGRALQAAKGFGKLDSMGALLRLANIEDPHRLDELQRAVIRLLAEHGDWNPKSVNANQSGMLRNWGLPTEQAALKRLL